MQQQNLFDISTQSVIDVALPDLSPGVVYILEDPSSLSESVASALSSILDSLDCDETFNAYTTKVVGSAAEDFNIVCPVQDPVTQRIYYVVATSEIEELVFAVPAVIDEVEAQLRKRYQEALIVAAMEVPELYQETVDRVISDNDDGPGAVAGEALARALKIESITEVYDISEDELEKKISAMRQCALGIVNGAPKATFTTITARQKKEAFEKLPARLNKAYEQQNPLECEIVRQTMGTYTQSEIYTIVTEIARKHPQILKEFHSTAINSASHYEIHVRPWSSGYRKDFKDRYRYCIYLKDSRGKECPVTFKNYPSYCIYMMYIIDRYQRGDEVTDLAIKQLRNEFCDLYRTIFCEDDSTINKLYETMDYRKVAETGMRRKGRYDDYIKDIHETLERLVGDIDSIPLKVGHGRYLGVKPERIFIDDKLAQFKFA